MYGKSEEMNVRNTIGLSASETYSGHINYSIIAGAGGGKTTLLSIRICNQICEGIDIDKFVIITYTNAAAAELREKITKRLQKMLETPNIDNNKRLNISDALSKIELIQISTIHSFLLKILREHSIEAGMALDVRLLERDEAEERKNKFFDKWYEEHFSEINQYSDDWVISSASTESKLDYTKEVYKNMFLSMADIREEVYMQQLRTEEELNCMAVDYINEWLPQVKTFYDGYYINWPSNSKKERCKIKSNSEKIIDECFKIINADVGKFGIEIALMISFVLEGIKAIDNDPNECFYSKKIKNSDDVDHTLSQYLPSYPLEKEWAFSKILLEHKVLRVVDYVNRMKEIYQKSIDTDSKRISNDDILYKAKVLLENNKEILDTLRARYEKIYVDEFQDTTKIQKDIVLMLAGSDSDTGNGLLADRLVVVGDPKQSIYRFTGAELAVYESVNELMDSMPDEMAQKVCLNMNFRSNSDIVRWVNESFGILMKNGYNAMETDWVVNNQDALHGVFQYRLSNIVPESDESDLQKTCDYETVQYSLDNDINVVAQLVKNLVNNEKIFIEERTDHVKDERKLRQIRYSDIMIISRNTLNMSKYVEILSREGIPVNVQGKFDIDNDKVLNNYISILQFFAVPKNKKYRMEAIQVLMDKDITCASNEEITVTGKKLFELENEFNSKGYNSAAVARYILNNEWLFVKGSEKHSWERIREYRIRLNQMVETCISDNKGDLYSLARLMNEYVQRKVSREIPLESNENAVRLMNVHQSKGLTGNIVIIADRAHGEKIRYDGFKKNGRYYPAACYSRNTYPVYMNNKEIMNMVDRDTVDEQIRLQYVAATRAAHALIILPRIYSKTYRDVWFSNDAYKYDDLPDIGEWINKATEKEKLCEASADEDIKHEVIRLRDLSFDISNDTFENMGRRKILNVNPSDFESAGVTGFRVSDEGYTKENRPSGNVFGTVMHRVYELIIRKFELIKSCSSNKRSIISRLVNQAIIEQDEELCNDVKKEEFHDYITDKMIDYVDTVIGRIMSDAVEIYPEYTFSFYQDASEVKVFLEKFAEYKSDIKRIKENGFDGSIWVNGQADLVVKYRNGQVKVYDYKSDSMNGKPLVEFEKSLQEKYKGQLELYEYAVGKAFSMKDIKTEIIHLYHGN